MVKLTIDGKRVEVPERTLVIEAARRAGIEIPSFCYYEGLSLAGACRMCLVEVEKMPKLMTACTLPVAEGMAVRTDTPQVAQARKSMLEFVLTNHPLDCPVCDKGGECELQDATLTYGAGEGRFEEFKQHLDELQWSPVVYFDRPRCILCFRCVRICDEGMGVRALGVADRACPTKIIPNHGDHLECDECGMCIDICPVGALTSGMYRYKTRPWEMEHIGTICTHCGDGCKTTLGIRNGQIMRGNNRDRSGINGEFLCIKGRYAGDFNHHPERLQSPLMRHGQLEPVSWSKALTAVTEAFRAALSRGDEFGVIGSNHTTNEENFVLQKLARHGLRTNNIDHHRTGDVATLLSMLGGRTAALATTADLYTSRAILVVGSDLAQQHSFLSFQIRANWRHHQCHIYVVTPGPVREDQYATRSIRIRPGEEVAGVAALREQLRLEPDLVILFGDGIKGAAVDELVELGDSLGIPVKYVCLLDYSNSRGAADMGLLPDRLPGNRPLGDAGLEPGRSLPEILEAEDLGVLWVIGANPLGRHRLRATNAFVVVQDLFLTETAKEASVVLPVASVYEKDGTVTNVCGEVQRLRRTLRTMGTKSDLEIFGLIANQMGLDLRVGGSEAVFEEIRASVAGYALPLSALRLGQAVQTMPLDHRMSNLPSTRPHLIRSAGDTLFTSGTLGRYSGVLNEVMESPGALYR